MTTMAQAEDKGMPGLADDYKEALAEAENGKLAKIKSDFEKLLEKDFAAAPARTATEALKELAAAKTLAEAYVGTGLAGSMSVGQVTMIMLMAKPLNIDPLTAPQVMYVTPNGKVGFMGDFMRDRIYRYHGGEAFRMVERSVQRCVIDAKRRDQATATRFSYTIEEAKHAGLTTDDKKKYTWQKYEGDMLFGRATSRVARAMFSDCFCGGANLYTPEELGAPVKMDEETGEVTVDKEKVADPKNWSGPGVDATEEAAANPVKLKGAALEVDTELQARLTYAQAERDWLMWTVTDSGKPLGEAVLDAQGEVVLRGTYVERWKAAEGEEKGRLEAQAKGKQWMKELGFAEYPNMKFWTTSNLKGIANGDQISCMVKNLAYEVMGQAGVRVQTLRKANGGAKAAPPDPALAKARAEAAKALKDVEKIDPAAATQLAGTVGGDVKALDAAQAADLILMCDQWIKQAAEKAKTEPPPKDEIPF